MLNSNEIFEVILKFSDIFFIKSEYVIESQVNFEVKNLYEENLFLIFISFFFNSFDDVCNILFSVYFNKFKF